MSSCSAGCLAQQPRTGQTDQIIRLLPTLECLAGGGAPGSFLEMGALDGVYLSNTLLLERCCGWRGVLIPSNSFAEARCWRHSRAFVTVRVRRALQPSAASEGKVR